MSEETEGQTMLADLWVHAWQAVMAGCAALAIVNGWAPPEHLPWTPLDLSQPIGAATATKVAALDLGLRARPDAVEAGTEACMQTLRDAGVEVERAEDVDDGGFCVVQGAVRLTGGDVTPIAGSPPMRCALAARYVLWDRQVLRPAAQSMLGSSVSYVDGSSYACRRIYGRSDPTSRPSEHAQANALDIPSVTLADGRRVSVLDDWGPIDPNSRAGRAASERGSPLPEPTGAAPTTPTPESRFLHRLRDGACQVFGTVLSPEYNEPHRDHLHLDGSTIGLCS